MQKRHIKSLNPDFFSLSNRQHSFLRRTSSHTTFRQWMMIVIPALFSIFTSLCISSSTTDARGLVTVAIHIHSSVGCWVGPAEPVPVLASVINDVRNFSWRLSRYEKSKGMTMTVIVTGKGRERGWKMRKILTS